MNIEPETFAEITAEQDIANMKSLSEIHRRNAELAQSMLYESAENSKMSPEVKSYSEELLRDSLNYLIEMFKPDFDPK